MRPYYADESVTLYHGHVADVLPTLEAGSVDCIVTSPPYYGLRDYGVDGQIGLEASPAEYVETMRAVFAEVRRVLADDGVMWLNLGDSYSGSWGNQSRSAESPGLIPAEDGRYPAQTRTGAIRPGQPPAKNLMGIPWRVAFALQDDGWTLRNAVIWHKPNAMPTSVEDRLACKYELVFLFANASRYRFDLDAIREPHARGWTPGRNGGRNGWDRGDHLNVGLAGAAPHDGGANPGDVWTIATQPFPGAHFATMPLELARRCILAGCKPGGTVLDPFSGSGTTGASATSLGRRYVGIDLNADYLELSLQTRLAQSAFIDGEPA